MVDYVERLQASKIAKLDHPCIFDESNVRSFFGIMDPANKGYINHSQYMSGIYMFTNIDIFCLCKVVNNTNVRERWSP